MSTSTGNRIKSYKVICDDGTIYYVQGVYAAHAWAIAKQLHPSKEIKGFYLLAENGEVDQQDARVSSAMEP